MGQRTLRILIVAAVAMVAFLYFTQTDFKRADNEILFPGLREGLNDVQKLTITAGGDRIVATLERGETRWTLAERSDYPADVGKIRQNLIALADATVAEQKTSNPELYARLGVEDIGDPDASGVLLEIHRPDAGTESLIVGDTGVRGDMAYVRKPGEAQSLLVLANLDLGKETVDWLAREIVNIPLKDVFAVTISHPDGETLRIEKPTRSDSEFSLLEIPEGRTLAYATIANSIGGALTALSLVDVAAASEVDTTGLDPVIARFETFDGLVLEASTYMIDDDIKVALRAVADESLANRFHADADPQNEGDETSISNFEETVTRARELNEKLATWLYTIPSYKSEQLVKRTDDLLESAD